MIKKEIRDEIVAQALKEIAFARQYKQGKIRNWQKNEEMYYGTKKPTEESRANVDLGRMQEFVHTILSKIDNPLIFKYVKRKNAQLKRVDRANAVRAFDRDTDSWDIKDLVGKKQGVIYGRAIYSYHADSVDGCYKAHLENVDVYDFLIDPSAGGIDIERARYLGAYGVRLSKKDLRDGIKNGLYIRTEVDSLIEGNGTAGAKTREELNKDPRRRDQNVWTTETVISTTEDFKFWKWCTTYNGERYYLLLSETGARAIRVEKLTDINPPTKAHPKGAYPFWTWAAFPDLTEFWTPSYCDYVREIFMAQTVSINQMLDNSEQINKPQRVVNVTAIDNEASLKYRKNGLIKVKGDIDVNKAFMTVITPPLNAPLNVYNTLEAIQEKASGVTAAAKGVADDEGKVKIYEGNQENVADRFNLLNKSYSFGTTRFGVLHQEGMKEHLTKKIAIDIMGPDGIEQEMIGKRDIFRKDEDFGIMTEASNADMASSDLEKKNKMAFLTQETQNQTINPKKATEMKAQIAGFSQDEITQLMDTSDFGDAVLMSEADRDIESILDGKTIKPNRMATTAYKQKFVNFMLDHEEDMNKEQKIAMFQYMGQLDPIIMTNMLRKVNEKAIIQATLAQAQGSPVQGDPRVQGNPELRTEIDPALGTDPSLQITT